MALKEKMQRNGTDFSKLGRYCNADEGALVRYFRMSIQILREVQYAPTTSTSLQAKIKKVIPIFNRDIVDAEKQLRTQ